jgi:hypothetical protein
MKHFRIQPKSEVLTHPSLHSFLRAQSRVARFFLVHDTKTGKMYQISTVCTEWSQNIPNIHKIFQMAIKYINIFQSEVLQFFAKPGFLV